MASKIFLRSLCFLLLSTQAIAAPSRNAVFLKDRADNSAGIGVELEWRGVEMDNDKAELKKPAVSEEMVSKIKGTPVKIDDVSGALLGVSDWSMTAEHFGSEDTIGISKIVPEFIVDGLQVKIGTGRVEKIGTEILNFLNVWLPSATHESAVTVPGFEQFGKWTVTTPKAAISEANINLITFGQQVTAPMPLAGILAFFQEVAPKAKVSPDPLGTKDNPLLPTFDRLKSHMHLVEASHVDNKDKKTATANLSPESLGFFSLVVSYAKAAKDVDPEKGIKHLLPIMPRTDFITMYKKFVEPNLKEVFDTDSCDYSLYKVVKKLAEFDGDGSNSKDRGFSSASLDTVPITWKNSATGFVATLKIETWMDGLEYTGIDMMAEFDKTIDAQIGGLGSRMETLAGASTVQAPIFEFRDLQANGNRLPAQLKASEDTLVKFHKTFNSGTRLRVRADAKPASKSGACSRTSSTSTGTSATSTATSTDTKTTDTASKTATTTSGPTTTSCPEGKKPTNDGKGCKNEPSPEIQGKCPDGKILDEAEGGQDKDTEKPVCVDEPDCKDDETPSVPLYKPAPGAGKDNCVKKPAEDKQCEKGQYRIAKADGSGVATYECKDTRKTEKEKKEAADKKAADEKKAKEEEERKKKEEEDRKNAAEKELKEKKRARGGLCMVLVGTSGLLPQEEIPGLDDLNSVVDDWPSGVELKGGDLSNSNLEIGIPKLTVNIGMETAGLGGIISALIKLFKPAAKGADEAAEAAAKTASAAKAGVKTGSIGQKAGDSLKKIRDHPSFLDCLAGIATVVGSNALHVDAAEVPEGGFPVQAPSGSGAVAQLYESEDARKESFRLAIEEWTTYSDDFWHWNRIVDGRCNNLKYNGNLVSGFNIKNTCCTFYLDKDCKNSVFAANRREDGELEGKENDNIESFMCTDSGCDSHPK